MKLLRHSALAAIACVLLLGATRLCAQGSCTFTDENGKTETLPNCGLPASTGPKSPPPATSNKAKKFPYPGDPAQDGTAGPAQSGSPAQPGNPAQSGAPAAADGDNKRFPYPGDTPPAAPGQSTSKPTPAEQGLQDAGSSGSSSSSSSGDSSSSSSSSNPLAGLPPSPDDDTAADDTAAAARRAARKKKPELPKQTPSEREQEDVQVAGFYQNDGNYRGAYARASDAVALDDQDPDAHLAFAEAARKLGKLDEAETHYKRCLELDPVPKTKKAAEKALKEMTGGH